MSTATLEPFSSALDDSELLFEVIDDKIVELPPKGTRAELVANAIGLFLSLYVEERALGIVLFHGLYVISPKSQRRPDVAFVSKERWPLDLELPDEDAWNVVPNLVVEVVSRHDRPYDVLAKLREYFDAGVEQAWIVIPPQRQVYVYTSLTSVAILDDAADLDGGSILPGFRVPVADIFPKVSRTS